MLPAVTLLLYLDSRVASLFCSFFISSKIETQSRWNQSPKVSLILHYTTDPPMGSFNIFSFQAYLILLVFFKVCSNYFRLIDLTSSPVPVKKSPLLSLN